MRLLKWSIILAVCLPALWFGLLLSHWLPLLSDEQQAALDLVEKIKAEPLGERNAYPLLWFLPYDIPVDQLDQAMAEDLERFAEFQQAKDQSDGFVSVAESRSLNMNTADEGVAAACYRREGDCLGDVREHLPAVAMELQVQRQRLEREMLLEQYDHVARTFPRALRAPLTVPGGIGGIVRVAAAHEYLTLGADAALQRLCRHTRAWRTLRSNTDVLVIDVLGQVTIAANAALAARILAEQPQWESLPCLSAFDPLADSELMQCRVMIGEQEWMSIGLMEAVDGAESSLDQLQGRMINWRHTLAMSALQKTYYCSDAHRVRIVGRSADPPPPEPQCTFAEKLYNPYGCVLMAIAQGLLDPYYLRALDLDARLRLLKVAQWLRAHDDGSPLGERLRRLPDHLRSPSHAYKVTGNGRSIGIELLQRLENPVWSIPVSANPDPSQ